VDGSVEDYLKKLKGGYGDEIEIRFMKEIFNTEITIWIQDTELGATTDVTYPEAEGSVHIAYRDGVQYDAIVPLTTVEEVLRGSTPEVVYSLDSGRGGVMGPGNHNGMESPVTSAAKHAIGNLSIIFWNSNGWEQERCEKIAEVALEEEADVICVLDARMHPARKEHMKGYEGRLERVTGKKWKGKVVNRPEKIKGCNVGGSILFTSHNCADVMNSEAMKYCVMNKISFSWMGERVNVISTYKPYPNRAKGSLLSAVNECGDIKSFEEEYWEKLKGASGLQNIIIGGDFNVGGDIAD
jgi:hypothetical protein